MLAHHFSDYEIAYAASARDAKPSSSHFDNGTERAGVCRTMFVGIGLGFVEMGMLHACMLSNNSGTLPGSIRATFILTYGMTIDNIEAKSARIASTSSPASYLSQRHARAPLK